MAFTIDELLLFSARSGNIGKIHERVNAGADITNSGALIEAVRCGHMEVIELLVELGADINATNENGIGALEQALHDRRNDIATWLLHRGAKLQSHSRPHWKDMVKSLITQRNE